MKPMQKSVSRSGAVIAAAGVALALTLSGCGGDQKDDKKPEETAQSESADDPGAMQGEAAQTEGPSQTAPAKSEPSKTKSEDPYADAARTTSWASDDGMKVDKEGDGNIPAASLEADLIDLFENKFDMKVKKAECTRDMEVIKWYGFETCNVTTKEKTYYGTVKLIDHKDKMIKYELVFPGIDKSDVDF